MKAVLTVLRGPRRGETREIDGTSLTLGRGEEAGWQVASDRALSRLHCRIAFEAGGYEVVDLSTNGVFLNGAARPLGKGGRARLASGDRIALGPVELLVKLELPSAEDDPFLAAILGGTPIPERPRPPAEPPPAPLGRAAAGAGVGSGVGAGPLDDLLDDVLAPLGGAALGAAPAAPRRPAPSGAAIPDDWLDDPLAAPAPAPSAAAHSPSSGSSPALPPGAARDAGPEGDAAAWEALAEDILGLARHLAATDPELAANPIVAAPGAAAAAALLRAPDGTHRRRLFQAFARRLTQPPSGQGRP